MTLLERVYKKSTTKTLAAAARFRTSLLTDTDLEQAEFKKKTPSGVLTPYGGKAQSRSVERKSTESPGRRGNRPVLVSGDELVPAATKSQKMDSRHCQEQRLMHDGDAKHPDVQ